MFEYRNIFSRTRLWLKLTLLFSLKVELVQKQNFGHFKFTFLVLCVWPAGGGGGCPSNTLPCTIVYIGCLCIILRNYYLSFKIRFHFIWHGQWNLNFSFKDLIFGRFLEFFIGFRSGLWIWWVGGWVGGWRIEFKCLASCKDSFLGWLSFAVALMADKLPQIPACCRALRNSVYVITLAQWQYQYWTLFASDQNILLGGGYVATLLFYTFPNWSGSWACRII